MRREGGERESTCTLLPHCSIHAQELLTYYRLLYALTFILRCCSLTETMYHYHASSTTYKVAL